MQRLIRQPWDNSSFCASLAVRIELSSALLLFAYGLALLAQAHGNASLTGLYLEGWIKTIGSLFCMGLVWKRRNTLATTLEPVLIATASDMLRMGMLYVGGESAGPWPWLSYTTMILVSLGCFTAYGLRHHAKHCLEYTSKKGGSR